MKKLCYITTISVTVKAFFIPQLKCLSQKYDVAVLCSYDQELEEILADIGVRYIPVEMKRGISPTNMCQAINQLKNIFLKENFDLVQYSTPNAGFVAAIATKLTGVKVRNYHLMGLRYIAETGVKKKLLKFLEKTTCRLSTHIECVSPSNLELAVQENLFDRKKAVVVWNGSSGGVDLERFCAAKREIWRKEIRQKFGIAEEEFVFGFVGRITRDKGINEILQAFQTMQKPCKLLLIGQQEGIETLDAKLWKHAKQAKNVILLDAVKDIERYYAAMDVLLLPSYREGFGMVIAEAAAVGTPAIVSDIPGPIDVIDAGKTALTVEVKNPDNLADKMQWFLQNPEEAKAMSRACIAFIKEKFDSKVLCEKILERKKNLLESQEI